MGPHIIHDDDVTIFQGEHVYLFNTGLQTLTVERAIKDTRGIELIISKRGDVERRQRRAWPARIF